MLIEKGANTNFRRESSGATALSVAAQVPQNEQVVRLICFHCHNVDGARTTYY